MMLPASSAGAPPTDGGGRSALLRAAVNSVTGFNGAFAGSVSLATGLDSFAAGFDALAGFVGACPVFDTAGSAVVSVSGPKSASGSSPGSPDGKGLAMTLVTAALVQDALPSACGFQKWP